MPSIPSRGQRQIYNKTYYEKNRKECIARCRARNVALREELREQRARLNRNAYEWKRWFRVLCENA